MNSINHHRSSEIKSSLDSSYAKAKAIQDCHSANNTKELINIANVTLLVDQMIKLWMSCKQVSNYSNYQ